MDGKAHLWMGGIFGLGASALINHDINLQLIGLSVIAATLPDFDTGSSVRNKLSGNPAKTKRNLMIGGALSVVYSLFHARLFSLGTLAGCLIFLTGLLISKTVAKKVVLSIAAAIVIGSGVYYHMVWLGILGAYLALAPFAGHRTWTHSIWAVIMMYIIFKGAENSGIQGALTGGMAGFISHLAADAVTVEGIALLYPILPIRFGIKLMHSGQVIRQYSVVAVFAAAVILLVGGTVGFQNVLQSIILK